MAVAYQGSPRVPATRVLGLLLVLLVAASASYAVLQVAAVAPAAVKQEHPMGVDVLGPPSTAVESMLDWIKSKHGVVNVAVRVVPGQGRITLAPRHIAQGNVLAAIPKSVCFETQAPTEAESAVKLWREMQNVTSPLQPYLRVLPDRPHVSSFYDIPVSYLPLIQNAAMARAIQQVQAQLVAVLASPSIESAQLTAGNLQYAMSLLKTRAFDCGDLGQLLVPIIDLANHYNDCPHSITTHTDCGAESPGGCIVWRAGADIPAGGEVCNNYHTAMLQDRSILQYGMLQRDEAAVMMSGIDRHDFDPEHPWAFQANINTAPFTGTTVEVQAEAARLSSLLANMESLDSTLKILPDPEADADGLLLNNLLQWRAERKAAIAAEHSRLLILLNQLPDGVQDSLQL